jgi:hypothetical protein
MLQDGSLSRTTQQLQEVYIGLRKRALEMSPASVGVAGDADNGAPWGILMEMGYPNGIATLVSFATGDASLYFSAGGGVIGGGAQEDVSSAAKRFVSAAQGYVDGMKLTTSYPLPESDQVKFYVLTSQGVRTAEDSAEALGRGESDLSPLFYAGQDVITGLRILCQQREQSSS